LLGEQREPLAQPEDRDDRERQRAEQQDLHGAS
jgi:hypothetical protein